MAVRVVGVLEDMATMCAWPWGVRWVRLLGGCGDGEGADGDFVE